MPFSCVGKLMWLVRLKSESRERNWAVWELDGLLQGMLKSPVITKLEQVLARLSREEKSLRKVAKGLGR